MFVFTHSLLIQIISSSPKNEMEYLNNWLDVQNIDNPNIFQSLGLQQPSINHLFRNVIVLSLSLYLPIVMNSPFKLNKGVGAFIPSYLINLLKFYLTQ